VSVFFDGQSSGDADLASQGINFAVVVPHDGPGVGVDALTEQDPASIE
jgi:hypothetical protein